MQTIQMLQQFAPATAMVAIWTLPWITVAAQHAFGVAARDQRDDNWGDRALAAVRWAGAVIEPAPRQNIYVRQVVVARASERSRFDRQLLPHAA
jgi:hypothetical protein